jgi:hypothetical protein
MTGQSNSREASFFIPTSKGLTICSDFKAPAQNNNQGQRWTLVTPLFEGLVMRNDHSEICNDLLSLWGEVGRSAVTLQFEWPYNQISHN